MYGSINITKTGHLRTMKLIHKNGSLHCNSETSPSFWGCTFASYGKKLSTIITDTGKNIVLPPVEDLEGFPASKLHGCSTKKHFYSLGETSHNSTVLVFRNLSSPLSVSRNQELHHNHYHFLKCDWCTNCFIFHKLLCNNGNKTEWSLAIRSVIIRVIDKIGQPRNGSPIC